MPELERYSVEVSYKSQNVLAESPAEALQMVMDEIKIQNPSIKDSHVDIQRLT